MVVTMARWRNPLRPLFLALIVADCSPTMTAAESGDRVHLKLRDNLTLPEWP